MREFIHIGFPKTATTTLQEQVFARQSAVANLGRPSENSSETELLAGYHIGRPRLFLSYLQASPLAFRDLQPERAAGIDPLSAPVSEAADEDTNAVFLSNMRGAFSSYAEVYAALEERYADYKNIRFFDIRRLFESVDEHVFNDINHTNARGNQIIAERMAKDIRVLEDVVWPK